MKPFFIPAFLVLCLAFSCFAQQSDIDSLRTLLAKDKEDTVKINHFNLLSRQYINTGSFDTSRHYSALAMSLAQKLILKNGISASYSNTGIAYYYQGDYTLALNNYLNAIKTDQETGNRNGIGNNYGNIGIIYDEQGNFPLALDYYLKALKISEELGNKRGMETHLGNIAIVYYEQKDFTKALDYYFRALKIAEELLDKNEIARHLGNIGLVYSDHAQALINNNSLTKAQKSEADSLFGKALDYFLNALK